MTVQSSCRKFWGGILGNLRPAEHSLPPPPTKKSAYNEQGFISLSKIQRSMDQKNFNSERLICAHKTGTKE